MRKERNLGLDLAHYTTLPSSQIRFLVLHTCQFKHLQRGNLHEVLWEYLYKTRLSSINVWKIFSKVQRKLSQSNSRKTTTRYNALKPRNSFQVEFNVLLLLKTEHISHILYVKIKYSFSFLSSHLIFIRVKYRLKMIH